MAPAAAACLCWKRMAVIWSLLLMSSAHSKELQKTAAGVVDARLVNGDGRCSGHLEMKHKGQWRTLKIRPPSDSSKAGYAEVACRQMGCGSVVSVKYQANTTEPKPAWEVHFYCQGSEETIMQCREKAARKKVRDIESSVSSLEVVCSGPKTKKVPPTGPSMNCQEDSCSNQGVCLEQWEGFTCDCSMTSYVGPLCNDAGTAYLFGPDGGLVVYTWPEDERPSTREDHLALGFSTGQEQATLLRVDSAPPGDSLQLQIDEGYIRVVFKDGTDDIKLEERSKPVNDGMYHIVRFTRSRGNMTLQLDDLPVVEHYPSVCHAIIFKSQTTAQVGGGERGSAMFQGQLSGLYYNGLRILNMAAEGHPHTRVEGGARLVGNMTLQPTHPAPSDITTATTRKQGTTPQSSTATVGKLSYPAPSDPTSSISDITITTTTTAMTRKQDTTQTSSTAAGGNPSYPAPSDPASSISDITTATTRKQGPTQQSSTAASGNPTDSSPSDTAPSISGITTTRVTTRKQDTTQQSSTATVGKLSYPAPSDPTSSISDITTITTTTTAMTRKQDTTQTSSTAAGGNPTDSAPSDPAPSISDITTTTATTRKQATTLQISAAVYSWLKSTDSCAPSSGLHEAPDMIVSSPIYSGQHVLVVCRVNFPSVRSFKLRFNSRSGITERNQTAVDSAAHFLVDAAETNLRGHYYCSYNFDCAPEVFSAERQKEFHVRDASYVRLVGEGSRCLGRLEVEQEGEWRPVSQQPLSWSLKEAAVVCRQLGCGSAIRTKTKHSSNDVQPVWRFYSDCDGSERALLGCGAVKAWLSASTIDVLCSDIMPPPHITVLADRPSNEKTDHVMVHEGHSFFISCSVEAQFPGGYFTLAFTGAKSLLGLSQAAVRHQAVFTFNDVTKAYTGNYSCVYHNTVSQHDFTFESKTVTITVEESRYVMLDDGVQRDDHTSACSGKLLVQGGASEMRMVMADTSGWDMRHASIVCRQLGCGAAVSTSEIQLHDLNVVWHFFSDCEGSETALLECGHVTEWVSSTAIQVVCAGKS